MLIGTYSYKIDSKGRIPIPAPFRGYLGENYPEEEFILVAGMMRCLYMQPRSIWERHSRKLKNKYFDAKIRKIDTFYSGHSALVSFDKQGRILIPSLLKEFAQFKNDIIIVGNMNWIELWSADNWKKFTDDFITSTDSFEQMEQMLRSIDEDDKNA